MSDAAQDWFKGHQQFWNQWTQNHWSTVMNGWQKTQANNNRGAFSSADYSRMFSDAGQGFLKMMESFSAQPLNMQEAFKSWSTSMESMVKNLSSGQGFNIDPIGFMAGMPGIGYHREKQEKLNTLYRLWAQFQKDAQVYNEKMTAIGIEALKEFNIFVQNPPADAKPLQSLKDIYLKWVDISEDLYGKYAVTEEYTKMYGATVNSLMHFKKKFQELTDDTLDQLGIPSRRELDSLHKRVHELAKENRELRKMIQEKKARPAVKTAAPAKSKKRK